MSQEPISSLSNSELSHLKNHSALKNDTQWKKRVNLFRLVYAFLITNNSSSELIENLDEDSVKTEVFQDQNQILQNIITNFDKYKNLVQSNLKNWVFQRLSVVDQALFLCAIGEFEVLHTNKKILIDQTLITAKRYSAPNAYKYINAILDKILK